MRRDVYAVAGVAFLLIGLWGPTESNRVVAEQRYSTQKSSKLRFQDAPDRETSDSESPASKGNKEIARQKQKVADLMRRLEQEQHKLSVLEAKQGKKILPPHQGPALVSFSEGNVTGLDVGGGDGVRVGDTFIILSRTPTGIQFMGYIEVYEVVDDTLDAYNRMNAGIANGDEAYLCNRADSAFSLSTFRQTQEKQKPALLKQQTGVLGKSPSMQPNVVRVLNGSSNVVVLDHGREGFKADDFIVFVRRISGGAILLGQGRIDRVYPKDAVAHITTDHISEAYEGEVYIINRANSPFSLAKAQF